MNSVNLTKRMAAFDVDRFYRDVRLFRIFEGTSEIHKSIIAREMIKQAEA